MISANTSCAAPSRALTVVNERREDYLGLLRDCETGNRIVLRNCPGYIRVWMAADETH